MREINIILAASDNNVIGNNNELPWRLPADMKHFRETTRGHAVIMGRKTHESIGMVLPKRTNIVITRNEEYKSEGCEIVHSLEESLSKIGDDTAFIIGGSDIYNQAIQLTDKIILTRVHLTVEGDAHFIGFNSDEWMLVHSTGRLNDNDINYTIETYERLKNNSSNKE